MYLLTEPDPVYAVAHIPDGPRSNIGVLFCPPFGSDELCTRRSLRAWATVSAGDGHAALRIDLPGSGDSGGSPRAPGRMAAWMSSVGAAAQWLRASQHCERVVAVGIGLGGVVALAAVADGAAVDDLVLWSVPARGRLLLRELRAFAQLTEGDVGADPATTIPPVVEGDFEVGGFLLSAETTAALEALDLTAQPLPDAQRGRRVLLLGRDTLPVDRRLREHLEAAGADVTVAEGPGYARMVTHPQFAETPHETIEVARRWIASAPVHQGNGCVQRSGSSPVIVGSTQADLRVDETEISETIFEFDCDGLRVSGILSEPIGSGRRPTTVCAVFLNAGSVRRIGPNRMWVECARRWAACGVPSLRFDGIGIGDSDGDERRYFKTSEFYEPEARRVVHAALDELSRRQVADTFLVSGVCSGAYSAFHVALDDTRVRGLILVNLWAFFWNEQFAAARDARRAKSLISEGAWLDVVRIALSQGRILRSVKAAVKNVVHSRQSRAALVALSCEVDAALDRLRDNKVTTLLLLCRGEPLAQDLVDDRRLDRLGEWPNLLVENVPLEDHIFRPLWAQALVHQAYDMTLERMLDGLAEVRSTDAGRASSRV
jgi:pimeloyl-ACP methyl ester carboxylesterase